MKLTGFKFSFNPKRAFDRFTFILKIIGWIIMLSSPYLIYRYSIMRSDVGILESSLYFLCGFGGAIALLIITLYGIFMGIEWIKENGDKEIEIDLTDIKLTRKSKYKELS